MMMTSQMVKVQREKIAVCMNCPLCNKLFEDATTISECLHTFCRICIYEKLTDEELNHCPVCNIDLGCAPLEKLRADHTLQGLRDKVFPFGGKADSPELMPSVPCSGKRKERSLSSLGVSIPRLSARSGLIGRRLKSAARKSLVLQESTLFVDEPFRKEEDDKKVGNRHNPSNAESSKQYMSNKGIDDYPEPCEGKTDLRKPINCLVEAANKTKSIKFTVHGTLAKPALPDAHDNESDKPKAKRKRLGHKSKGHGDGNDPSSVPSGSMKPRKFQGSRQRRAAASKGLNITGQALDVNSKHDRRFSPIWFALVASNDKDGDAPLPQISSCYLRVKSRSCCVVSH
ncbi:hypothetical protein F2P56_015994 [Juglans regia]|uniref:E3 ubiquitin protein ligase DRIP2-like isoform X2 n=2 Tax=Juglans regia TaxID=51240 RepID=A0A2I4EGQ7_JUGRE|nr:E3 ubiquitin protein ligase DRIP2-like isoform X2 [Juglans regia]KAF5466036.1 hypothetical protein F2P56_015994 [Juglans regia]